MRSGSKFIINGILASLVGIALRTVTLIFGAYISRVVGAEGVGLNTLVMSVYSFALTFATSGVGLTVTRLVAAHIGEGRECDIGRIMRGATLYALAFSFTATAVLSFSSGLLATAFLGDRRAVFSLQILSLSLIPSALSGVIGGYFIARRMVARGAVVQILSQLFRILATVAMLAGAVRGSVEDAVGALSVGLTLTEFVTLGMYLILYIIERVRYASWRKGTDIKPVARTALPLAASAYIRAGLLSLEHAIIPRRLEKRGESLSSALSSFGSLHGAALPVVTYPMTPLSSFAGLLLPEFAESEASGNVDRLERIAKRAISLTLAYAIIAAVTLFSFSEELGYAVYGTYASGYFISILAPVIPVMYIDHVVDSMLKGIGEQVYSMWVNIADSALSVILVWLLIPLLGIEGYAIVIIIMEVFNLTLSYMRLGKRIRLRINAVEALIIPLIAALCAAFIADFLFVSAASLVSWLLVLKIVFSVSLYIALYIPLVAVYRIILNARAGQ